MLPNIILSGPSGLRRAPKYFSYQLVAAAGAGTFKWMWSRMQHAKAAGSMTCRITNSLHLLFRLVRALFAWTHVVESDQIDVLAFTVFRDLEQIDEPEKTRLARQLGSDIRKPNGLD